MSSNIREEMINALTHNANVQKVVRGFISDQLGTGRASKHIADDVCEYVGQFRTAAESMYPGDAVMGKKANSICNDVSRICRDELGYSVVCYKRRGKVYSYKAILPKVRAARKSVYTTTPPPLSTPSLVEGDCKMKHFDASIHTYRPATLSDLQDIAEGSALKCYILAYDFNPETLFVRMAANGTDMNEFAKELVKFLKEVKKMPKSEEAEVPF